MHDYNMRLLFYLAPDIPVIFTVARNFHLPTNDGYVLAYVYGHVPKYCHTKSSVCIFVNDSFQKALCIAS